MKIVYKLNIRHSDTKKPPNIFWSNNDSVYYPEIKWDIGTTDDCMTFQVLYSIPVFSDFSCKGNMEYICIIRK